MFKEKKVFYRSGDGIKICGIITRPPHPKDYVLMAHGITMDKNEWNNFYVDIAQELYKRNFATLRFDFRGHGESEGKQREVTIVGELLDMKASANEISKYWKDEISVVATSFGAGPAILYATQNKIRSLVLLCPVIDYVATFLEPTLPWAKEIFNKKGFKQLEKEGYILLDDTFEIGVKLVEEFKVIKPYKFLKDVRCPVLTIHGDKDTMVPYKISKKYGTPNKMSKFITLKDADHGFVDYDDEIGDSEKSYANKKFVIEKIVGWFEKWL
jgi:pimeloyl-ACP methyl ester carboxylesterase